MVMLHWQLQHMRTALVDLIGTTAAPRDLQDEVKKPMTTSRFSNAAQKTTFYQKLISRIYVRPRCKQVSIRKDPDIPNEEGEFLQYR